MKKPMRLGRRLSVDEAKRIELGMLERFSSFCADHDLRYSLSGGTMLGAVRHKGFIPWDDDIDLCMPRPDFEKLIDLAPALRQETGLELNGFQDCPPRRSPFLKLENRRYLAHIGTDLEPSFLWIDVFPVDGLPADDDAVAAIYRQANLLRRTLFFLISKPESKDSALQRTAMAVAGPALRRVPGIIPSLCERLSVLSRRIPYGSTPYVGAIGWGIYGPGERMELDRFEDFTTIEFEGKRFSALGCWDSYLTGIYGDYLQLPPEDKRVAHDLRVYEIKD